MNATSTPCPKDHFDVAIVGAGMIGAGLACGLAKHGFSVAIIDRVLPPQYVEGDVPNIRVSALSLASENILRNLDAWKFVEAKRCKPYQRLAVNEMPEKSGIASKLPDISSWARTEFDARSLGHDRLGHIVENNIIQLGLHERMAEMEGIKLFCPSEISQITWREDLSEIRLEDQTINAELVIGADGAQSRVRHFAELGQRQSQYEQHAFVITITYRGAPQDITWQSFTTHGPLAFLPLSESAEAQYGSLVWYDHPERIAELKALSDDELRKAIVRNFPKELPPIETIEARASFPLFKSHALSYCKDRVALVGDAAHTINPLAGQGVNLGFLDLAELTDVLSEAKNNGEPFYRQEILKRYEKRRRLPNQGMMNAMDVFYYGFENIHFPVRIARNLGLGIANKLGFAKNKVMAHAIGLSGKVPPLASRADGNI